MQPRHLMQEGVIVERKPVGDFVEHGELGPAQQIGLPQRQYLAAQLLVAGLAFLRRQVDPLAPVKQGGDLHLAIDRALAAHFGRVRGQDRADQRLPEEASQIGGTEAGLARMRQRAGERCRTHGAARAHLADIVLVFGDVGEVRKIAERAHDAHGLADRHAVEDVFQLAPGQAVFVTVKPDRGLPDALDQVEHVGAFLVAYGVAEDAPEQANILPQPGVCFEGSDILAAVGTCVGIGRHDLGRHRICSRNCPAAMSRNFCGAAQDQDEGAAHSDFCFSVMAGLVPAIHVLVASRKTWMPGTRPGMTMLECPTRPKSAARPAPNRDRASAA